MLLSGTLLNYNIIRNSDCAVVNHYDDNNNNNNKNFPAWWRSLCIATASDWNGLPTRATPKLIDHTSLRVYVVCVYFMYRISKIYNIYILHIIRGWAHKSNTHAAAKLFRWKAFMIDESFAAERKSLVLVDENRWSNASSPKVLTRNLSVLLS